MPRPFCPRTLGRICWQVVAIIMVVFALAVSLFRGLLPKLDDVRNELINYVETQYQVTVQLSELSAEWQAFGPAVTVNNLVLPPQENLPVTLIVKKVQVKLDFWETLITASPQIENVIFEGVHVALDIDKLSSGDAKSVSANEESSTDWAYQLMLEQLERFAITDVTVQLLSKRHEYRPIHIENLRWRNLGSSHRAQGQLFLDQDASEVERLSLSVDITGSGYRPDELTGQVYLAAKSLDLGEWASRQVNPYNKKTKLPLEGVVNLEAWFTLANRQLASATIAFEPSWLQWKLKDKRQRFEIQAGQINWLPSTDGWQLSSSNLAFVTNDKPWPEPRLLVSNTEQHFSVLVNQIDTRVLLPLLPLVPGIDLEGLYAWQAMSPQGKLNDLRLDYGTNAPLQLTLSAQQITWNPFNGIPGSQPIDLKMGFKGNDLYLWADAQNYLIDFDDGFEAPIALKGQPFSLKYALDSGELVAPKLQFDNQDLNIDAALKMQFNDKVFLSLAADVDVKNAANAKYYFPKHGMSESLISYLEGAIKAGQSDDAKVVWHGALSDFPYQDNSGVFQAGFSLSQAQYEFQPDWPEVTDLSLVALFENAAMDIWVDKGQLLDVAADGTHVAIPEMSDTSLLTVRADLHTNGDAAKTVLLRSPLADSVGATLKVVQVQGDVEGKLDLAIPLYEGGQEAIRGTVLFKDTPVYISEPGVQLDAVNGQVYFVNEVVTGEGITAKLFEQPVSFSFDTGNINKNYGLNLDMNGLWQLDQLPALLDNPLQNYYQGNLAWQGAMTLVFDQIGYRIQAQVSSDLDGVELSLPGTFAKTSDSKRRLSIELIGDNKQSSLGAKLGDQLEFWGGFDELSGDKLAHFDLLLGRLFKPGDELRRQEGHLLLDLPATEFSPWLPIIKGFTDDIVVNTQEADQSIATPLAQDSAGISGGDTEAFFPPLTFISGSIKQLNLFGQPFSDLTLTAQPSEHGWRFEGAADQFDGRVDFYPDWSSQGLKVVAKHFDFAPAVKAPTEAEFSHDTILSNLPPLAVDVDEFSAYGRQLGHLVLQATPIGGDYKIQTVSIKTPGITLRGKGAWLNSKQENRTEFQLDLQATKFDEFSERLGIDPGLKNAPLDMQAEVAWTGAPYAFSIDTLNGQISYKLGKGHLSEVSDKGARIFSLFSLDSLLRKLSLDFSDVFGKGLYFNSFTGTLNLDNGVVKTTDSEMDAVAGNMRVRGYTDLTTESLNYDIRFVPQLASSVPTVVLLSTGGWTLGLGAFALTKVLEPVIEVISEIRFRLTGTMSEPKLEELERKSKEIEIPESVLPRTAIPTDGIVEPSSNVNDAGVEIPAPQLETPPVFNELEEQKPEPSQPEGTGNQGEQKEQVDAGKLITMSKQSRCQSKPEFYQRAA
ncbi:YhdP family protein [Shewanella colwelliana]|uniref:YhdP family protein n=1 Tax=Shewanella colwelliana TaxID=23 RepID=UPI00299CEAAE|nr:YhdP family protein [Shewanella colwelliana]MDX1282606.1 YhdP family protein [Shewanella colwelliana]